MDLFQKRHLGLIQGLTNFSSPSSAQAAALLPCLERRENPWDAGKIWLMKVFSFLDFRAHLKNPVHYLRWHNSEGAHIADLVDPPVLLLTRNVGSADNGAMRIDKEQSEDFAMI